MKNLSIAEEKHLFGEDSLGKIKDYKKIAFGTDTVHYIYSDNSFTEIGKNGVVGTGYITN